MTQLLLFTLCILTLLSQSKTERIDLLMQKYADIHQFNGSILVAEDGDIIFKKGYGFANFEWDIKNTPDTKFRLASVSKQFTAMLIMLEVQNGTIDLKVPITNYIKEYPKENGDKITTHHLLTHTAGIPNYTSFPGFFKEKSQHFHTPEELMKLFWEMDLEFEVGSQYKYSNSGYHLLGVILERVTGKPYDILLKERIFDPLEMHNSGYDWNEPIIKKRANAYQKSGSKYINAPYIDMSIPYSAGSIYSTVEDLYKWDQSIYDNELLSEELTEKMFSPFLNNYAYGWSINEVERKNEKVTITNHSGGVNGFSTRILRFVDDKHLIVLLDNTSGGKNSEIAENIDHILYDMPITEPKPSITYLAGDKSGNELSSILQKTKSSEQELNSLGYSFLKSRRIDDAIIVFEHNAKMHSKSANTFDSLGEAYLESGDKEKAISTYKKAHELDPTFPSPVNALKALGVQVELKNRNVVEVDNAILKTYVGKYELQPGFVLTITLKNKQLTAQATGQGPAQIFPESNDKFFLKVINAQIKFNKDDSGKIESLTLFQGGREMKAKKI